MGRVMGIDYGSKRCGIAVSDPLRIIASPLETIPTHTLMSFLQSYIQKEPLETIVLGMPLDDRNLPTHSTNEVIALKKKLEATFPHIHIASIDERYTSKMAVNALQSLSLKQKDKRNKLNVDKVAAALILRDFLERSSV